MRLLGVGSRFSFLTLALASFVGQAACSLGVASTGERGEQAEGAALNASPASSGPAPGEPQQVVQRMVVKSASAPGHEPAPAGAGRDGVMEARASAAGASRASAGSLEPRSGSAETITSKHLEAELNRLEAELAN